MNLCILEVWHRRQWLHCRNKSKSQPGESETGNAEDLNIKTKVDMLVPCVFSRLLYAAKTWTMRATDSRKLLAPKKMVWWYCRLVWMYNARGSTTGTQQTRVEMNHWPQRPAPAMRPEDIMCALQMMTVKHLKTAIKYNNDNQVNVMPVHIPCYHQLSVVCYWLLSMHVRHRCVQ